jgi:two-component system chemotaxis sensor kinase CheA
VVARLLRLAHTLKGAARVVKQGAVSELAHEIEEVLAPFREATGPFPPEQATRLFELVDGCNDRLKPVFATSGAAAPPPAQPRSQTQSQAVTPPRTSPPPEPEKAVTDVRVEIADMDALLSDLADAATHLGAFDQTAAAFDEMSQLAHGLVEDLASWSGTMGPGQPTRALHELRTRAEQLRAALVQNRRALRAGLERTHRDVRTIRERASDLRLMPAKAIFPVLERTARDAADALKKRVAFTTVGDEHRLDAHVLLAIRDALAHVVRNAVSHGIEPEVGRVAAGKPAVGRVQLRVHKRGQRIHFAVEDDGGGLNLTAIQDALIARNLLPSTEARALGIPEATRLLLQGGLSTAAEVTEVMGRGIGMDVVRATVSQLKGDVNIHSERGKGTTVELLVPVSLESLDVLVVEAAGTRASIPFDAVRQTLRLGTKELVRSANGLSMILEGHAIPFLPLAEILSKSRQPGPSPSAWSAIVLRVRDMQAAVGVNRLHGVRNVVVRPLPALCGSVPLVSGAALNLDGNPELVLDPTVLVNAVRSRTAPALESEPPPTPRILVTDDSLTSRMLEQSVLESAGYRVDLAVSGEDALEKAKLKPYSLFVVDVEMPGLNGFEVLERFRADPQLQRVPAILVTSRVSPEDRRRGEQVGARAHIAKGEFEETQLLHTIRRLLGEGKS